MFGGLTTRGQLDPVTQLEFERLYARLNEFLSVSFTEDGELITPAPAGVVPVGGGMEWWSDTAPDKWIFLVGQQLSRVTYKGLFEIWGTTYGVGDGSTTFNAPDARGRFTLNKSASGTGSVLGETGGEIDHTHALPGHNHSVSASGTTSGNGGFSANTSSAGGHSHTTGDPDSNAGIATTAGGTFFSLDNHHHTTDSVSDHAHSVSVGDHTHTVSVSGSTDSTSSGDSDEANPPYIVCHHIVYSGVSTL